MQIKGHSLRALIADDMYIAGFQTMGQYRSALLKHASTLAAQQAAVAGAPFPTFEDWLASDIASPPENLTPQQRVIAYARLAFNAGLASSRAPGTPEAPRELPPLPTPTARMYSQNGYRRASVSAGKGEPLFAAEQMRDYARAAQIDGGQGENA